jgi:hypothetical protein
MPEERRNKYELKESEVDVAQETLRKLDFRFRFLAESIGGSFEKTVLYRGIEPTGGELNRDREVLACLVDIACRFADIDINVADIDINGEPYRDHDMKLWVRANLWHLNGVYNVVTGTE